MQEVRGRARPTPSGGRGATAMAVHHIGIKVGGTSVGLGNPN
ncbi:hypothetical protein BS78_05G275600 [Paspalum vaginatum]|nr:hypothetical protein BS78_05G275600 [Paspalum vaginatum]